MARTAIPVTSVSPYGAGANLTSGTAGDAANDMSVAPDAMPRLHLLCSNAHSGTVAFTLDIPSGSHSYNEAATKSHTVPAATGAVEGKRVIILDGAGMIDSDGTIHITSADANFALVTFYAYTWTPTGGC